MKSHAMFFDWQEKQRKKAAAKLPGEHRLTKSFSPKPKRRKQRLAPAKPPREIGRRRPALVWVNPNPPRQSRRELDAGPELLG